MTVTTRKRAAEAAPTPRSSKRLKSAPAKPSPDTPSSSAKAKQKRPARHSQRVSASSRKLSKPKPIVLTPAEREQAALTVALSAARVQYSKELAQLAEGAPLHDAEFYFQDACTFKQRKQRAIKTKKADMVVLLAENTLFRLPRTALVKHSELFAGMFEVPPPMNEGAEGRNDERPIILYDIKAEALRWFVRYMQGT
ncbi:hypothetical protein PENSPDRAFT_150679 [Peniophora sp. CONT]|nr:hypothetical protein PENSPDRAFT_150679 [Peniophora sp. CONT]